MSELAHGWRHRRARHRHRGKQREVILEPPANQALVLVCWHGADQGATDLVRAEGKARRSSARRLGSSIRDVRRGAHHELWLTRHLSSGSLAGVRIIRRPRPEMHTVLNLFGMLVV